MSSMAHEFYLYNKNEKCRFCCEHDGVTDCDCKNYARCPIFNTNNYEDDSDDPDDDSDDSCSLPYSKTVHLKEINELTIYFFTLLENEDANVLHNVNVSFDCEDDDFGIVRLHTVNIDCSTHHESLKEITVNEFVSWLIKKCRVKDINDLYKINSPEFHSFLDAYSSLLL